MKFRSLRAYGVAVLLGAAMSVVSLAAPASASCTHGHYDWDTTSGKLFDGSYINIRSGPHLSCGVVGTGQLSHNVSFWCYTWGDTITRNGETMHSWTYLKDTSTGVSGWVADLYLVGNGSGYFC